MKAVVLDGYTINPGDLSWDALASLADVTFYERTPKDQLVQRIGDCQALFTTKVVCDNALFEACPNLAYIGLLATGYNNVDLASAKAHGVTVTNVPNYSTATVAQFTIGLLLEMCLHIGEHNRSVQEGNWHRSKDFSYWNNTLIELDGKTLGIIGLGSIGKKTAAIAQSLGMHVVYNNGSPTKHKTPDTDCQWVPLAELLAQADVVSLHCPLTEETTEIINQDTLAQMKPTAMLINAARGGLVNETHLAHALNTDKLFAAAVDVVSVEPITLDNPLLSAKNCIITPHMAWGAKDARERLIHQVTENFRAYTQGEPRNTLT